MEPVYRQVVLQMVWWFKQWLLLLLLVEERSRSRFVASSILKRSCAPRNGLSQLWEMGLQQNTLPAVVSSDRKPPLWTTTMTTTSIRQPIHQMWQHPERRDQYCSFLSFDVNRNGWDGACTPRCWYCTLSMQLIKDLTKQGLCVHHIYNVVTHSGVAQTLIYKHYSVVSNQLFYIVPTNPITAIPPLNHVGLFTICDTISVQLEKYRCMESIIVIKSHARNRQRARAIFRFHISHWNIGTSIE